MEPSQNPSPEETANPYTNPKRQADMQQKLAAERAYVQNWGKPDVARPDMATIRPMGGIPSATSPDRLADINQQRTMPTIYNNDVVANQAMAGTYSQQVPEQPENKSDLVTISLVLAFAAPLAGLILGVISAKRSRRLNASNRPARIAIILNIISLVGVVGVLLFLFMPS